MRKFGLIGYPLSHSFSKKYFTNKFQQENILDCAYELFPLPNIEELPQLLKNHPDLAGLNVTIPYKQAVFKYLNSVETGAQEAGAVNVVKITNGQLKGYNSDVYGFGESLLGFIDGTRRTGHSARMRETNEVDKKVQHALILGTGGAAKAVMYVLKQLNIAFKLVSRSVEKGDLTYQTITKEVIKKHQLIINTTPLGTAPNVSSCPDLPYELLTPKHYLFDLVYNPEKTLFLAKGLEQGAKICNGLAMLHLQAEKSWEIWNK